MTALNYRPAVGIVVANTKNKVLLARRNDMVNQWQFPQGGIDPHELPQETVFRELEEETGIPPTNVEILGSTQEFLKYDYPSEVIKALDANKNWQFAGQAVHFFLLRYLGTDENIDVQGVQNPEFDAWRWVDFWEPVNIIVEFKREMYLLALTELEPVLQIGVVG